MKKVIEKNKLKDLIFIQENKPIKEKSATALFKSILEPIIDNREDALVLYKLNSTKDFSSILKRLEFSEATIKDYSKKINLDTQFLYVLTERYGVSFIWDESVADILGEVGYYLMYNSKNLNDSLEIIQELTGESLGIFSEKWHPDRRENVLMNASVRKIIASLSQDDEIIEEIELETQEEEKEDLEKRLDFLNTKSRHFSHEIRNQLSICDLYSEILKKSITKKNNLEQSQNAIECIQKSLKIASNVLLELKSLNNINLKEFELKDLIQNAVELSKVYKNGKNIEFEVKVDEISIMADENRFISVIVNLVKNAVEAIEEKGEISIKSEVKDGIVSIFVENNGQEIEKSKQKEIFQDGFSTKTDGYGVGLFICKKNIENMYGQLILKKSDKNSTIFEIKFSQA